MLVSAGRHPSVIQQHGAFRGSDQGRGPWSLILEFYPEGDLWQFCADRLPLPQALSLLHNLLLGLQHIHSRKIFHRDVKPENILVSCERAVLCDFGVAELLELRTLQRARGLTPQYASPEMVTSNSMDPRGDVYAAGATFHFMITLQYVSTSIKKKWSRWWSKPESELCFEKPPLAQLPVVCHHNSQLAVPVFQDLLLQMICPERKRLTAKEAVRHYAFWSLADPEDYGEASSHAHSYLFPAGDLSQTPSDVAPLSIFGTESVSAWRERVVAPGANGASGTSSEASSRRSGRRSSHTSASTGQQVIEEQISVDESMEILKQKLRFPPEQSSSWGRETKKPRPPGHMQALAEHLPRRPSNLSKVEPEPAELPVIPAELQREAQHPTLAQNAHLGVVQVVLQGLGQGFMSTILPAAVVIVMTMLTWGFQGPSGLAILAASSVSGTGFQGGIASFGAIATNAQKIVHLTTYHSMTRHRANLCAQLGDCTAHAGNTISERTVSFYHTSGSDSPQPAAEVLIRGWKKISQMYALQKMLLILGRGIL
eukprot:g24149.t1